MSGRKQDRKPSQMAGKAKQGMKDQGQRMERDADRMSGEMKQDMDRLGAGTKRDAQQARSDRKSRDEDMKNMSKEMRDKLQHH